MSYVYVFDFEESIKVGITIHVQKRLHEIETSSGRRAKQIFFIEGNREIEKLVHWRLSEYRLVGEYFNCTFQFAVDTLTSVVKDTNYYLSLHAAYEREQRAKKDEEKAKERAHKKEKRERDLLDKKLPGKNKHEKKREKARVLQIYLDGKCNCSGERIREAREKAKLSQEQLAARIQLRGHALTQKAISRAEAGQRIVPDFEIPLFAAALGVDPLWLLGMKEDA